MPKRFVGCLILALVVLAACGAPLAQTQHHNQTPLIHGFSSYRIQGSGNQKTGMYPATLTIWVDYTCTGHVFTVTIYQRNGRKIPDPASFSVTCNTQATRHGLIGMYIGRGIEAIFFVIKAQGSWSLRVEAS